MLLTGVITGQAAAGLAVGPQQQSAPSKQQQQQQAAVSPATDGAQQNASAGAMVHAAAAAADEDDGDGSCGHNTKCGGDDANELLSVHSPIGIRPLGSSRCCCDEAAKKLCCCVLVMPASVKQQCNCASKQDLAWRREEVN